MTLVVDCPLLSRHVEAMARSLALVCALLVGNSLLAGTLATAAAVAAFTGAGRGGGSDLDTTVREAAKDVQLLVLKKTCGAACQADTAAVLAAAGCDRVRLFSALQKASARCTPAAMAADGGGRGGGGGDLRRLPGVQSVSADAVVAAMPPLLPRGKRTGGGGGDAQRLPLLGPGPGQPAGPPA